MNKKIDSGTGSITYMNEQRYGDLEFEVYYSFKASYDDGGRDYESGWIIDGINIEKVKAGTTVENMLEIPQRMISDELISRFGQRITEAIFNGEHDQKDNGDDEGKFQQRRDGD